MALGTFTDAYWGGLPVVATVSAFEQAVVSAVTANSAVTAVVGSNINPLKIPEDQALPGLCYRIASKPRPQGLDGPNGTATAMVSFTARSNTETAYSDVKAVVQALRNAFDGLLNTNLYGVTIIESALKDESDDYLDAVDASDTGTFEEPVSFLFRYREPLPVR